VCEPVYEHGWVCVCGEAYFCDVLIINDLFIYRFVFVLILICTGMMHSCEKSPTNRSRCIYYYYFVAFCMSPTEKKSTKRARTLVCVWVSLY